MKKMCFSAEMVRALREGRKTQTRRPIKPQPYEVSLAKGPMPGLKKQQKNDPWLSEWNDAARYRVGEVVYVGETVWVSECGGYYAYAGTDAIRPVLRLSDGQWWTDEYPVTKDRRCKARFIVGSYSRLSDDGKRFSLSLDEMDTRKRIKSWTGNAIVASTDVIFQKRRAGRFLPEKFARDFLKITSIRAQRVQDISEEDAIAEGVLCEVYDNGKPISGCWWDYQRKCWSGALDARGSFRTLWDSIYGPGAWERNDWVWVYTIEGVKRC